MDGTCTILQNTQVFYVEEINTFFFKRFRFSILKNQEKSQAKIMS